MQTKENKMGVMPIDKLLISMSLPMMISMLVQALYNIVDSIFVSRIDRIRTSCGIPGIPDPEPDDRRSSGNGSGYQCVSVQDSWREGF